MGNAENNILRTYLAPDHLDVVFSAGQLQQAPKTLLGNVLIDVPVLVGVAAVDAESATAAGRRPTAVAKQDGESPDARRDQDAKQKGCRVVERGTWK